MAAAAEQPAGGKGLMVSPHSCPAKNIVKTIPTERTSEWSTGNSLWVKKWPVVSVNTATVKVVRQNGTAIISMQVSLAALEEPYVRAVEVDVGTLTIKHPSVARYRAAFDAAFEEFKKDHEDEVKKFFEKKSSQVLEGYGGHINDDVVNAFVDYVAHPNVYNKIHAVQKGKGPCAYELLLEAFDEFKVLDIPATRAAMTAIDGETHSGDSDSDSDGGDGNAPKKTRTS